MRIRRMQNWEKVNNDWRIDSWSSHRTPMTEFTERQRARERSRFRDDHTTHTHKHRNTQVSKFDTIIASHTNCNFCWFAHLQRQQQQQLYRSLLINSHTTIRLNHKLNNKRYCFAHVSSNGRIFSIFRRFVVSSCLSWLLPPSMLLLNSVHAKMCALHSTSRFTDIDFRSPLLLLILSALVLFVCTICIYFRQAHTADESVQQRNVIRIAWIRARSSPPNKCFSFCKMKSTHATDCADGQTETDSLVCHSASTALKSSQNYNEVRKIVSFSLPLRRLPH